MSSHVYQPKLDAMHNDDEDVTPWIHHTYASITTGLPNLSEYATQDKASTANIRSATLADAG